MLLPYNSFNQREKLEWLKELDSCRKSIYQRTNADQWMMNESIHYNNWGTLSVNDFKPLVEAFKDLFDVFRCSKCGGLLRISYQDRIPKSISCPCDEYSWNLLRKTR